MSTIVSIRHDGVRCVLCDAATRRPLEKGSEVTSFRGEKMRVLGGQAPHKPGSQGFVDVTFPPENDNAIPDSYYVSVVNAVWLGEGEHN